MYILINGVRLFFDVDGEGLSPDGSVMRSKPTVVMVHGGPGADHSVAKPFFSQLTDVAQVVYYDHRGNGRSDMGDESSWNLGQWGADLKCFCDALGIVKPIVIGTSFGGFVTLSYATQFPGHAGGLVLISTAAKVDFHAVYSAFERLGGPEISKTAREYWENPTDSGRELYKNKCVPLYRYSKDSSADWMSRVLWKNETALWFNGPSNEHGRFDFRDKLTEITTPALVMVGEEDPITPVEFSELIANRLGSEMLTYLRFDQCGHGVVGDKPHEALEALRRFVGDVSSDGA